MKPKIFALYLPQFYEMKENNEWWGKGYTDWTAVKMCIRDSSTADWIRAS